MTGHIPDGFERHFRKSPATDPWEPLYSRRDAGVVQIGLRVREAHCNGKGFLHGGVLAALADNAMGLSWGAARTPASQAERPGVTAALSIDYLASARPGQWVVFEPRVLKTSGSTGVVDALVRADGVVIARANATYRVPAA